MTEQEKKEFEEDQILEQMLREIGLTQSVSQSRRLLAQGAVSVDQRKITKLGQTLPVGDHEVTVGKTKSASFSVRRSDHERQQGD